MDDEDEFGALYGEAQDASKPQAPKAEPSPGAIPTAPAGTDEALFGQLYGDELPSGAASPPQPAPQLHPAAPNLPSVASLPGLQAPPNAAAQHGDDDDDFEVQLDDPQALAQSAEEDDDDDFDVQLDEQTQRGRPTQQAQRQVALSNAAIGAVPGQAAAAIPGLASAASTGPLPLSAPALPGPPARTAPPPAIPGSAGYGMAARPPPGVTWARPKYVNVHTGAFVVPAGMNKAELERQAVWPSQAAEQPDKLIKLPGQTKVGEDEYKEFLNLGHGGIFDLDLTRVFDAPWEHPSADITKYFNYSLNPATWAAYQARVQQYREAFILQHKIPVLPDARDAMPTEAVVVFASFPPELKGALETAQLKRMDGLDAATRGAVEEAFMAQAMGMVTQRPPPHHDTTRADPGAGWEHIVVVVGEAPPVTKPVKPAPSMVPRPPPGAPPPRPPLVVPPMGMPPPFAGMAAGIPPPFMMQQQQQQGNAMDARPSMRPPWGGPPHGPMQGRGMGMGRGGRPPFDRPRFQATRSPPRRRPREEGGRGDDPPVRRSPERRRRRPSASPPRRRSRSPKRSSRSSPSRRSSRQSSRRSKSPARKRSTSAGRRARGSRSPPRRRRRSRS